MDWALLLKRQRAVFGDCCCACYAQHHIRRTRIEKVHRVKWDASKNGRPLHLYQNSSQCMSIIDDLAIYHISHGSLDFLIFNFPRVRHHFCASHLWRIGSLWKQTKCRSRAWQRSFGCFYLDRNGTSLALEPITRARIKWTSSHFQSAEQFLIHPRRHRSMSINRLVNWWSAKNLVQFMRHPEPIDILDAREGKRTRVDSESAYLLCFVHVKKWWLFYVGGSSESISRKCNYNCSYKHAARTHTRATQSIHRKWRRMNNVRNCINFQFDRGIYFLGWAHLGGLHWR